MIRLQIGSTKVLIEGDRTITIFEDGLSLIAHHAPQSGQDKIAEQLGLSVEQMNREHDLVHSLLAHFLGLPHSPTLYGVASNMYFPMHALEEHAVLGVQAYARSAGVDLIALAQKISERKMK